jgi:Zn-dependent metalloprotease
MPPALTLLGLAALLLASLALLPAGQAAPGALATVRLPPAGVLADAPATDAAPAPDAAFERLQARAAGPLQIHWNEDTGVADFLTGADPATYLPYTPTAAEAGNPVAIARGFLDENRALFGLASAADELRLIRLEPDLQLNYRHVRLAQVYHGIPVFGRQLIVHLDPQLRITAVNGYVAPGVDVATQPTLTTAQAEATALRDLLELQMPDRPRALLKPRVLRDQTQLMVHVDVEGKPVLAWRLLIRTESPLGLWNYFINARRPTVVHRFDSVEPIMRRRTYTADNSTDIPGRLLIDEGERSRDPIAQAAHDNAGNVYTYYASTFKRDAIDGQGGAMISTVHFGNDPTDAENAAWIGDLQQMIYGDGGRIFKPLPYGLDVVGHEFTHGVIDSTAGLIYQGQSGALNESFADIFGAMIDRSNWTIGEQVVKPGVFPVPYLRSLEDPNAQGSYDPRNPLRGIGQPKNVREYANLPLSRRADNGGVHINSGIPNHAAYLIAQRIGREKMEQIFYRALTQYLTPNTNFLGAANALVRAATDLYGPEEVQGVRDGLAGVGINVGGVDTTPQSPGTSTTPPRGPAQPAPQPQLPPGCTDLIRSGGFESDEGWVEVVRGNTRLIDTELPHTGQRSAWLGGQDQEPVQFIYQEVTIPANATNVRLDYFRLVHREKSGLLGFLSGDAQFTIALEDPRTSDLRTLEELPSSRGDDTWRPARFDLSPLAGKTVRVLFAAENPRGDISSMFVDDVALVACTTGAGPAAPPPPSEDLVYLQGRAIDADTGRGISGAQFFVLKPGLTATQAAADDSITGDEVIAVGLTDESGMYRTDRPIARGQRYSVIVVARGYRPILADNGVNVPAGASNPYGPVDGTLRRGR